MELFIKGFIIGTAKVLPGISGSLIAIRLNVYQKAILTITTFFSNVKENSLFIIKLGLGFILSTVITSKLLYQFINSYFFIFKVLFSLLIISGIPPLLKKASSMLAVFTITIMFYTMLFLLNTRIHCCPINYFVAGIIESLSTIIPGISGTAIYMNLGWYDEILKMFSNLYLFEFCKIIPFGIGIFITTVLLVNFIKMLILKYERLFYDIISSLVIVSLLLLFK